YTKSTHQFLFNDTFYNPLKTPNLPFNPIKLNHQYQNPTSTTTNYHQTFNQLKPNTPPIIHFNVPPKKLTLQQLKHLYRDHYQY
ncbi:immunodominant staphylococcal antigen IsaB family protein, partial [Staphylococcus hominis]